MDKEQTNRQKRAMETRARLIEAAKAVITEKGFERATIGDIVRKAAVSTGTFYTYFSRKEDVAQELGESDFMRLASIVNAITDKSILDRLQYYSREFLRTIEGNGIEICRQWVRNNLSADLIYVNGEKTTKYRHDFESVRSVLKEGISRGELQESIPLDEIALFINSELYGLMIAWCMTDAAVIGSEKVDALFQHVFSTVLKQYIK